jgi:putative ABC transport system substrate-binding protein
MSYGPHFPDLFRPAADYVDKIFNGVKPAEIPVEQPTKFELVINLKTGQGARAHNSGVVLGGRRPGDRMNLSCRVLARNCRPTMAGGEAGTYPF